MMRSEGAKPFLFVVLFCSLFAEETKEAPPEPDLQRVDVKFTKLRKKRSSSLDANLAVSSWSLLCC